MKNNIAFKLAKASVLKDKKSYLISFSMMLIAFIFTFVFSSYLTLSKQSAEIEQKKTYGGWSVCYENQDDAILELLSQSDVIDEIVSLEVNGVLSNGNYIANYSSDYFKMNSVELLEGDYPLAYNEVVVLKSSGKHIGDSIQISYEYPQKGSQTYQVVGIMNDYSQQWSNPAVDYFVYNHVIYNRYTYVSSALPIADLIGIDDCIYNFSLLSQDVKFEIDKQSGIVSPYKYTLSKGQDNTMMNSFILVVSAGLFIAVFYNVNQREKSVFLLRCIGMSKKNMRQYIFFEVIIITIIALLISLVVGSVMLLGLSIFYYTKIQSFLFVEGFIKSVTYISLLLVFIVCFVYLSILPISIHSMDSLIHKKERKIMKKYHKAKYMSIPKLSEKMGGRYIHYVGSIASLILIQVICINSLFGIKSDVNDPSAKYEHPKYDYFMEYYDEEFLKSIDDVIEEKIVLKYRYMNTGKGMYYVYSTDYLDRYRLINDAELPQNKGECLMYDFHGYDRFKVNETVYAYKDVWDEALQKDVRDDIVLTVVGEIGLNDLYWFTQDHYYLLKMPVDTSAFVVSDDTFEEEQWKYFTFIRTNKNIFFQVNELSNHHSPYYVSEGNQYSSSYFRDLNDLSMVAYVPSPLNVGGLLNSNLIYAPVLAIAILFVVFMMRLLVERLNKDLKLTRCLGMTFKQTMLVYLNIGANIIAYPMIYFFIMMSVASQSNILFEIFKQILFIAVVVSSINLLGFILYAYKKTNSTVTFYPTDVERYY